MSPEVAHIVRTASSVCEVDNIRERSRFVRHVRARRIVCVYLTLHLHFVQREAAEIVGRDRSTVADLVNCHEAMLRSDPAYKKAWGTFMTTLEAAN